MSNLINAKTRFGYNPDSDLIYDYLGQTDVKPIASYLSKDGTWNLLEVKRLILANQFIDSARIGVVPPAAKVAVQPVPPAKPAPAVVSPIGAQPVPGAKPVVPPGPGTTASPLPAGNAGAAKPPVPGATTGLSSAQLIALKLSATQAAALGLTPTQMQVTGVTAAQVKNWGMTPARADALNLTAEQRKVLLP